jgi:hypothetical protein
MAIFCYWLNVGRIDQVRYPIHLLVQFAHSGEKGTVGLVEAVVRGNAGYNSGEKIAIKANLNNTTDLGTIERLNSSLNVSRDRILCCSWFLTA